jgi:hypothetical protein
MYSQRLFEVLVMDTSVVITDFNEEGYISLCKFRLRNVKFVCPVTAGKTHINPLKPKLV